MVHVYRSLCLRLEALSFEIFWIVNLADSFPFHCVEQRGRENQMLV